MAENGADIDILQEWAPMSELLNKIPTKVQIGLFSHDINLTCVDIIPEFIALGSNLGVVYWYDRKKKDLQRLRCENQNAKITCIKVISTVDFMLACGNSEGQITIFQIPKSHPDSIPENLKPKLKQVERYTVSELHNSVITSLEWSKNGMKLFSGDKNGLIVLTELDFYMHLSKSADILNEAYEVVQLCYCNQQLLVSTTFRTIVCQKQDKWKVCQVGKKDRKSLGTYGGIFLRNGLKPTDILIYSTRPGLRIWISDLNGTVQQTLLFKDLLSKECFEVPLRNPITGYAKKLKPQKEPNFGVLLPFGDNLLVTYSSDVIYVLDPTNLLVIATISHLRRILSVSTHKDELFILEGSRSLIRVSFRPEPILEDTSATIPQASTFLPIANSLKDLTNKLQTSSIISALPPLFENNFINTDYNVQTDITSIINAEEAYESSPLRKPKSQNSKVTESKIINQEIDDNGVECIDKKVEYDKSETENDAPILFKHHRRKKKLIKSSLTTSATSLDSTSSEERDSQINRPCTLNVSTIGTIGPDLRSPDSILNDIESKEKLLADMLNFDKIKFALDNPPQLEVTSTTHEINSKSSDFTFRNDSFKENSSSDKENRKLPRVVDNLSSKKLNENLSRISNESFHVSKDIPGSSKMNEKSIFKEIEQKPNGTNYMEKQKSLRSEDVLSYGPPSGSSNYISSNSNSIETPALKSIPNAWQLHDLTVNQDGSEASDSSLCDWEMV